MAILVIGCSVAQYLWKDEILGSISGFLVSYLCTVSFLIGIKNLDGDDYQRLIK